MRNDDGRGGRLPRQGRKAETVESTAFRRFAQSDACEGPCCRPHPGPLPQGEGDAAVVARSGGSSVDETGAQGAISSLKKGTVPLGNIDLSRRIHPSERHSPRFQQLAVRYFVRYFGSSTNFSSSVWPSARVILRLSG
jgi:hypothetical protein